MEWLQITLLYKYSIIVVHSVITVVLPRGVLTQSHTYTLGRLRMAYAKGEGQLSLSSSLGGAESVTGSHDAVSTHLNTLAMESMTISRSRRGRARCSSWPSMRSTTCSSSSPLVTPFSTYTWSRGSPALQGNEIEWTPSRGTVSGNSSSFGAMLPHWQNHRDGSGSG